MQAHHAQARRKAHHAQAHHAHAYHAQARRTAHTKEIAEAALFPLIVFFILSFPKRKASVTFTQT